MILVFLAKNDRFEALVPITCHLSRNIRFVVAEPHAPTLAERMDVLRTLHSRGFITSVSAEPYLSNPADIAQMVAPFVNETIWIGTMSGKLDCAEREARRLRALYSREFRVDLARRFHIDTSDPLYAIGSKIRWKAKLMIEIID